MKEHKRYIVDADVAWKFIEDVFGGVCSDGSNCVHCEVTFPTDGRFNIEFTKEPVQGFGFIDVVSVSLVSNPTKKISRGVDICDSPTIQRFMRDN